MPGPALELDWIDAFVDRMRSHVHVRLTDNVLIRMPNEAFKLNRTGARVLHHLLEGGRVKEIIRARPDDRDLPGQITSFFTDLSRVLGSRLCDGYHSRSLHRVPFGLGYIELPVLSEVALTWRCNLACRFCYAACEYVTGEDNPHDSKELDTHRVKRVLEIIRHEGEVPSVSFTGGEPTLRRDLTELIDYAHSKLGMRVNLITNGTRIDQRAAQIFKDAGLASAQVSIESPDPITHDALVGVKGAHEASLQGLKALKEAGVLVHPHSTISRMNQARMPDMALLSRTLGCNRFSANLVIPTGRGADAELAVGYDEIGGVLEKVMASAREHSVRFMWYSPTPLCLFNPVAHQLGNKGCSACEGLLSVDPYGRLLPCSSWKEPVGDLLRGGFKRLWFGQRARHLRDKREAHPACRRCEHFALCHGACPLYFRVHGYKEIEPALANMEQGYAV